MSSATPSIPLFGDAYLADTRHLSLEEHGAYLQLLMIAWRIEGCCLPDDDARLARMLGITAARWRKLKPIVMAFWTLENGVWKQARLSKERTFVEEKRAKNRASADARWSKQPTENKQGSECERISERNAPPPPPKKEGSVANATVGEADDPVKVLFDAGVKLLTAAGQTEKQARSLIGKWRKGRSDGDVLTALIDCRARAVSNPVEWLQKRFGGVKYVSASGHEYRGSLSEILREAERRADTATFWRVKRDMEDAPPPAKRKPDPPADPRVAQLVAQTGQGLRVAGGQR